MSVFDYPNVTCKACQGTSWWYEPVRKQWTCLKCQPPKGEISVLRARLIIGNAKLQQFRKDMFLSGGSDEMLTQLRDARNKLLSIQNELIKRGSTECLYIEDGKKLIKCLEAPPESPGWECWGCPNRYWPDKEIMELDRKNKPTYIRTTRPVYVSKKGETPIFNGPEVPVYENQEALPF